jgi:hypothetical protein
MDLMQRLGGRKFILALIVIAAAMAIELKTERGLSTVMAGFLGTLVATFSAANYAVTRKHMEARSGGRDMDQIATLIENRNESDSKVVGELIEALTMLRTEMLDVKAATANVGQSVVNISRVLTQKG